MKPVVCALLVVFILAMECQASPTIGSDKFGNRAGLAASHPVLAKCFGFPIIVVNVGGVGTNGGSRNNSRASNGGNSGVNISRVSSRGNVGGGGRGSAGTGGAGGGTGGGSGGGRISANAAATK